MSTIDCVDLIQLADNIKAWGKSLGFQQLGISDIDLSQHTRHLQDWLDQGFQGEMTFLENNIEKRLNPNELVPGTLRVISVRLNYLPPDASFAKHLKSQEIAYISRYALGRDYHKIMRNKLKKLGQKIQSVVPNALFRPFADSAPVLEHAIAEKAGIGWTGKHSLTLSRDGGSWFFLGELFINLPLPTDQPVEDGCGSCSACITMCPTQAIVEPYKVDARKCISYLTIEFDGVIPEEYRSLMGNRIYGCDDCQLVCPWNRYGQITEEKDFVARQLLHGKTLLEFFQWDEQTFLTNTEGNPIRRIGFEKWQRNIAVALGNGAFSDDIIRALTIARKSASSLVLEHIDWAISQLNNRKLNQQNRSRHTLRLTRIIEKGLPRDA